MVSPFLVYKPIINLLLILIVVNKTISLIIFFLNIVFMQLFYLTVLM